MKNAALPTDVALQNKNSWLRASITATLSLLDLVRNTTALITEEGLVVDFKRRNRRYIMKVVKVLEDSGLIIK